MKRIGLTALVVIASLAQVEWAAARTLISSTERPHDCGCRETTSCCCKRSATPASSGMQCHREQAPAAGACLLQSAPCGGRQAILMLTSLRDPVLYDPADGQRTEHGPSSPAPLHAVDRRSLVPSEPPFIPPEPSPV